MAGEKTKGLTRRRKWQCKYQRNLHFVIGSHAIAILQMHSLINHLFILVFLFVLFWVWSEVQSLTASNNGCCSRKKCFYRESFGFGFFVYKVACDSHIIYISERLRISISDVTISFKKITCESCNFSTERVIRILDTYTINTIKRFCFVHHLQPAWYLIHSFLISSLQCQ